MFRMKIPRKELNQTNTIRYIRLLAFYKNVISFYLYDQKTFNSSYVKNNRIQDYLSKYRTNILDVGKVEESIVEEPQMTKKEYDSAEDEFKILNTNKSH